MGKSAYQLVPLIEAFPNYAGGAKAFLLEHGDFVNDAKNCYVAVIEEDFISDIAGGHSYDSLFGAEIALPEDAHLSAIYFKKNLHIPNCCYVDYDSDYSASLIVDGNLTARALSLSGGNTLINGDCTVTDAIYGFYNHGELTINGETTALLIIADDYSMNLNGVVNTNYIMGTAWKTLAPKANVAIWDVIDNKKDIKATMDKFFMDAHGFDGDFVNIALMVGDCILRDKAVNSKKRKKSDYYQLSDYVKKKLSALEALQANKHVVLELNLSGCHMGEFPQQFRQFKAAELLNLQNNSIKALPTWLDEFANLRHLNLNTNDIKTLKLSSQQQANIESLNINDTLILNIQDETKQLPKLTELCFGKKDYGNGGDDWGRLAIDFDWSRTPNLQHLHINETGWFWPWDTDFNFYTQCPQLKYLHFGYIAHGTMGKHLSQLKQLEFYGYETGWNSDESDYSGQLDIDTLASLPNLAVLYVAKDGRGFDKNTIQTLRQRLPNLYISAPYVDAKFPKDLTIEGMNNVFEKTRNYQVYEQKNDVNVQKMLEFVQEHRLNISPKWFDKTWENILKHLEGKARSCDDAADKKVLIKQLYETTQIVKPLNPKTASWTHLMRYGYDLWELVYSAEIWYALRREDHNATHLAWALAQLHICVAVEQRQGHRKEFAGLLELALNRT